MPNTNAMPISISVAVPGAIAEPMLMPMLSHCQGHACYNHQMVIAQSGLTDNLFFFLSHGHPSPSFYLPSTPLTRGATPSITSVSLSFPIGR